MMTFLGKTRFGIHNFQKVWRNYKRNLSLSIENKIHNELVQNEFSSQSQHFFNYQQSVANKEKVLYPLIKAADIKSNDIILDLACGPGILSIECAKHIPSPQKIYCIDITPEFLDIGKEYAKLNNVSNIIEFIQCECENLTNIIPLNSIDIVLTRWTFHHFYNIDKIISEIYKILKPNNKSKFVMLENINSTDKNAANICNAIEKLRDSSHVCYYNENEITKLLNKNGFNHENINILKRIKDKWLFKDYMDQTNNESRCEPLQTLVEMFTKYNIDTGMDTKFNKNGDLEFQDNFSIFQAIK